MTLPIINTPEYRLNIPSTDEEIRYRPFLVKEEKILLIAQETGTDKATYDAIRHIIQNCCLDKVDINKLPLFDMEYIFLNIRAKSVGEVAKIKVKCPDDETTEVVVDVDLNKINVQMDKEHDARIQLSENPSIGILMSYPTFSTVSQVDTEKGKETEQLFNMITESMFQIWEGEETHDCMDYSHKEKKRFLESLSHTQFEKIQKFFDTMPTLKHEVEVTNPKTNVTSKITLQGNPSFFLVALSHINLTAYYDTMFNMVQHHNWNMTEIEHMLPWERDIYVDKLSTWIKEENERLKEQQRKING